MKDKIAEVLVKVWIKSKNTPEYTNLANKQAQAILDLIAKELPKEKKFHLVRHTAEERQNFENAGYNQCLKDIKHKLGVE